MKTSQLFSVLQYSKRISVSFIFAGMPYFKEAYSATPFQIKLLAARHTHTHKMLNVISFISVICTVSILSYFHFVQ